MEVNTKITIRQIVVNFVNFAGWPKIQYLQYDNYMPYVHLYSLLGKFKIQKTVEPVVM